VIDRSAFIRRPGALALVIVVAYATLLTVQVRRGERTVLSNLALVAFGPLLSVFDAASRVTREGVEAYLWQRDAALRAEALERENRALKAQVDLDRNLEREVLQLRQLLQAPKPDKVDIYAGRALARFGAPFGRYMLVSTSAPVGEGAAVVDATGLAGRVIGKAGNLLRILMITDPNSAVGVMSARTSVRGVAVGAGDHLIVRWVSNEADVQPGDLFLTSGEDGFYPTGLRVATVTTVENGGDYLKRIRAEPLCRTDELSWVMLLRKHA
jgi:rod shape-determining protein MreC